METKKMRIDIPDYLTIGQYQKMKDFRDEETKVGRIIHTISSLTDIDKEEIQYWSVDSMKEVYGLLTKLADHNNEFHSIIEWKGKLYGYAHMKQMNLGEYVDLENLAQDVENNLHKIAALMYRPIEEHRFNSLKFLTKNAYKIVAHKDVENVFDWYTLEKYDSKRRKLREEDFKSFPVAVILGAVSFFLTSASLYLSNTVYSQQGMTEKEKNKKTNQLLTLLTQGIGAGGGLSTLSVNPIYYRLQETPV